jgi:hypothetical protein
VVRYDDDAGVITAVVTGQADLVGTSSALFKTMQEKAPQRQLEQKFVLRVNDLGIGVRKDDPKLPGLDQRLGEGQPRQRQAERDLQEGTTAPTSRRTSWRSGSSNSVMLSLIDTHHHFLDPRRTTTRG